MRVVITQGIPGSGRQSFALQMIEEHHAGANEEAVLFSPNHHFVSPSGYLNYNGDEYRWARGKCLRSFVNYVDRLNQTDDLAVVDAPNLQVWEMAPYAEVALAYGAEVVVHSFYANPVDAWPKQSLHTVDQLRTLTRLIQPPPPHWGHRVEHHLRYGILGHEPV